MTREDIIAMALEAGFEADPDNVWITDGYWFKELARFADLVAAAERKNFCAALRQMHDSYSLASDPSALKKRSQS